MTENILSARFDKVDSHTLQSYQADGGYLAAKKALTEFEPSAIIEEVIKSNLRGLGGAGFPAGRKWSFLPKNTGKPVFLVVNADEGEPGTIKDRYLITKDPHALIEGIVITSFAIGSHRAYIYLRGEYREPFYILETAIEEAEKAGVLGKTPFGKQYPISIVIHRGAGAYICGEETALLESLEGKKGFPRLKPPFPAVKGLFGCPTIINNVETICCVPKIIKKGSKWFASMGTERHGGTRLLSVSGHVEKPGVYEAPVNISLKKLIFEHAGGIWKGRKLKGVIPGGISTPILTASECDVPMDFDSLAKAGSLAGSAGVMVMDETTCMVKALYVALRFFAHESCGQCSPCREGSGWTFKLVDRIVHGRGKIDDIDSLLRIANNMRGTTICAFGDAVPMPITSYIEKFRDEFVYHIQTGKCDLAEAEVKGKEIAYTHR